MTEVTFTDEPIEYGDPPKFWPSRKNTDPSEN
nr:MAG TPA: hypothetical protein [Caudoviricetes sp.]DAU29158.1 MAG TPA: hypothetical protein [Caudoviricetes sp.]